jgi:hypothetical protein
MISAADRPRRTDDIPDVTVVKVSRTCFTSAIRLSTGHVFTRSSTSVSSVASAMLMGQSLRTASNNSYFVNADATATHNQSTKSVLGSSNLRPRASQLVSLQWLALLWSPFSRSNASRGLADVKRLGHDSGFTALHIPHRQLPRSRGEAASSNGELLMRSRRGCIGEAHQGWRPGVNPNERTSSVENPTFDALCGLVRRPAVTLCCHSIYVIRWSYAEYSGAQP